MIDDLPGKFESWESYKAEVESHAGPSGFILFAVLNHGAWIKKVGVNSAEYSKRGEISSHEGILRSCPL